MASGRYATNSTTSDAIAARPSGRRRESRTNNAPTTGASATPRTWHCIVTAVPAAATTHQPHAPPDHARHAPASAIALESAMRFGFQMKVDSSIAAAEIAIANPATSPAIGPAMARASHHTTPTAAIPANAMSVTTASGESPPVRNAAGLSR